MSAPTYHPSSMPLAFLCAGSLRNDLQEVQVGSICDAAFVGSAVHEAIKDAINGALVIDPDDLRSIQPYADKHGVSGDAQNIAWLALFGQQAIDVLQESGRFSCPKPEQYFCVEPADVGVGFRVEGTCDLVSVEPKTIDIADFKSGRDSSLPTIKQLLTYAWQAAMIYEKVETFHLYAIWLRDREFEAYTFTREQVILHGVDIARRIHNWDGKFTAGAHCRFCDRNLECPARQAMLTSTARDLVPFGVGDMTPFAGLPPAERAAKIIGMLDGAKTIEQQISAFKQWIKALPAANDGTLLTTNDGRRLILAKQVVTSIVPKAAIKPLRDAGVSAGEIMGAVKLSKTRALDLVKSKAARGTKGEAAKVFLTECERAGALRTSVRESLKVKEV